MITKSAPWYSYQKKLKALFERDPQIRVEEIIEAENQDGDYILNIEVYSHEKFVALDRILPSVIPFGNVTLCIYLYDMENGNEEDALSLYKTIFRGNPIVKDFKTATDQAGVNHHFLRFQPEVLQFFDDDISDYNGNWSGLAQDIAREIFGDSSHGINFCTAAVDEDVEEVEEAEEPEEPEAEEPETEEDPEVEEEIGG